MHDSQQLAVVESALRGGDAEFHRLLAQLPAAAYTCDAGGLITYYNGHAAALWGREPKLNDPLDRFCGSFKLFWTDGTPIPHDQCFMALAPARRARVQRPRDCHRAPDGTRLIGLAHANPILDATGAVRGAVNVVVDITDRKRSELAHAQLAAIVESSEDAIVSKALDGTIRTWNSGAERLFGYTAAEAVGQSITLIIPARTAGRRGRHSGADQPGRANRPLRDRARVQARPADRHLPDDLPDPGQ